MSSGVYFSNSLISWNGLHKSWTTLSFLVIAIVCVYLIAPDWLCGQTSFRNPNLVELLKNGGSDTPIFVVTHQLGEYQERTGDFLIAHPEFASIPRLFLVNLGYPVIWDRYREQATLIQDSASGELGDIKVQASTVHFGGGFATVCLKTTIQQIIRESTASALHLHVHRTISYTSEMRMSERSKKVSRPYHIINSDDDVLDRYRYVTLLDLWVNHPQFGAERSGLLEFAFAKEFAQGWTFQRLEQITKAGNTTPDSLYTFSRGSRLVVIRFEE